MAASQMGIARFSDTFRVEWNEQENQVRIQKGSTVINLTYKEFKQITELGDYTFPRTIKY